MPLESKNSRGSSTDIENRDDRIQVVTEVHVRVEGKDEIARAENKEMRDKRKDSTETLVRDGWMDV